MNNQTNQGEVAVLLNPHHYMLNRVYINKGPEGYLLVAHSFDKGVRYSKMFGSSRGARIAFAKYFKKRTYKKGAVKSRWSHYYEPQWNRWGETVPEHLI